MLCALGLGCQLVFMVGAIAEGDVVIHELMYHPAPGSTAEEFVELKNVGVDSVDLCHRKFSNANMLSIAAIRIWFSNTA